MFDANNIMVEMTKNGLLPQILAPDAVKNVTTPVKSKMDPTINVAVVSGSTLNCWLMSTRPGEIIGPRLSALVLTIPF